MSNINNNNQSVFKTETHSDNLSISEQPKSKSKKTLIKNIIFFFLVVAIVFLGAMIESPVVV